MMIIISIIIVVIAIYLILKNATLNNGFLNEELIKYSEQLADMDQHTKNQLKQFISTIQIGKVPSYSDGALDDTYWKTYIQEIIDAQYYADKTDGVIAVNELAYYMVKYYTKLIIGYGSSNQRAVLANNIKLLLSNNILHELDPLEEENSSQSIESEEALNIKEKNTTPKRAQESVFNYFRHINISNDSYINKETFDIETNKSDNNFAVDKLIAKTVSTLNKKGYITNRSCGGHVVSIHKIEAILYKEEDLINKNGELFLFTNYEVLLKHILLSETDPLHKSYIKEKGKIVIQDEKTDYKWGVFKTIYPRTICGVNLKGYLFFDEIPQYFQYEFINGGTTDVYALLDRAGQSEAMVEEDLIEVNEVLLNWAESLPIKE